MKPARDLCPSVVSILSSPMEDEHADGNINGLKSIPDDIHSNSVNLWSVGLMRSGNASMAPHGAVVAFRSASLNCLSNASSMAFAPG